MGRAAFIATFLVKGKALAYSLTRACFAAEAAGRAEGMRTENVPMGPAVCAPDAPLDAAVLAELLPLARNLNSGPENAWVGEPAPC